MNKDNFPLAVNYDDIDITDDFMFSYVMRQPDICTAMLECLLPNNCKIRRLDYITADNKVISSEEIRTDTQKTLAEAYGKRVCGWTFTSTTAKPFTTLRCRLRTSPPCRGVRGFIRRKSTQTF